MPPGAGAPHNRGPDSGSLCDLGKTESLTHTPVFYTLTKVSKRTF